MRNHNLQKSIFSLAMILTIVLMPLIALAQTRITMPKNKYKVQDDVEIGRKSSVEVEKQFPVLNDSQANAYVARVGQRLVASIPLQFRQSAFSYNFKVVNASDINAFALPGGPMYVNRGMITAAKNEGEMAGVMAHEIAHVALRHATAQATKQGSWKNQLGTLGMVLGGAVLGGETGAQIGMLGAQAWMTKYSREYETQADILGAQIMADAGYDPRDLANMFQTIARESGGGRAPEWLSSHPDPGNRFQKINQEAQQLNVSSNPIKITRDFERIQAKMRTLPAAKTMAQLEKEYQESSSGASQNAMAGGRYSNSVALPSSQTRVYSSGNWMQMNVPSNWKEFGSQSEVSFAPEGAYGKDGITHGSMIGLYRGQSNSLSEDTQTFVSGLLTGNSYLSEQSGLKNTRIANRAGYSVVLAGTSPITRQNETVTVHTVQLRNGEVFYLIAVTPQQNAYRYNTTFRNMLNSLRLNDVN